MARSDGIVRDMAPGTFAFSRVHGPLVVLHWRSRDVRLGIEIGDANINDGICPLLPKSTDQDITSLLTMALVQIVNHRILIRGSQYFCGATAIFGSSQTAEGVRALKAGSTIYLGCHCDVRS
jgi:hypothetical protein